MKLKRLLVGFIFLLSAIFLLTPIAIGVYYNVNRLICLYRYDKTCNMNVGKDGCANYLKSGGSELNSFLKCSDGVLGFIYFNRFGVRLPIYLDRFCSNVKPNYKNGGFKTNGYNFNNLILKLDRNCFLENMASNLININLDDCLNLNILGEDIKFKVESFKFVYDFNEDIKNIGVCEEIYILMPLPFDKSLYKFLITAKRVDCGFKHDCGLMHLALENLYLVVFGGALVFIFSFLLAFLFSKFIYVSRRNRFAIKKKICGKGV